MPFLRSTIALLLLCLLSAGAQDTYAQQGPEAFSVDVVSVQHEDAADKSRLDIFTAIPHASLRFLKTGEAFTARYEVTASVFEVDEDNRKQQMIENQVWADNVSVLQFGNTQSSQHIAHSSYALTLDPGAYMIEIRLQDLASEEVYQKEFVTEVRDFTQAVSLSSLILVNGFDEQSQSISPVVQDRVFVNNPSFSVFYELYADEPQAVNIRREVVRTPNSRGLPILRWLFRRWQADASQGEISFSNTQSLNLGAGRNPVVLSIPVEGYEAGEYLVRVIAEDAEGNPLAVAERAITMDWVDEAEYQGRDIDMAIAQLRYIAKPKELRAIRDGDSKQERRERFIAFWEKRDPTPDTPSNERMEEYYYRIDFANRHYTANSNSGWETDRGHTLVLYGEPDAVDNNGADQSFRQPYEVWHYKRIGRSFFFLDKNGTGNFKLMVPTWNARSAIR
ncbi:MAG: GWxTD domain-containing protein [Bacteroidota bacterium]